MSQLRRTLTKNIVLICFILMITVTSYYFYSRTRTSEPEPIRVGILHSLTGTMGQSEKNVVDATLFAIDQINAESGVLGRKIKPIIFDGASDWPTFAKGAEQLITQDKVAVIFGCWTSASRKTILPVLEKHNHLLFYPLQYEGLEESPYVVYTGGTSNQQIVPGVVWAFYNLGKKFFLVGSDYIYPRASHEINKEVIKALGGTVVGEEYIVLGSEKVDHIVQKIIETQPDVILNILVSKSNVPFFQKLRAAGITPEKIPAVSFTFSELELQSLEVTSMIGDYAALNYFQSVATPANKKFIEEFREKYGQDRVVSDFMEAAYFAVHLWSQTVESVGSIEINKVRPALKNQSYDAPEGVVSIDENNQHMWKIARVAKIQSDGQFNIVWDSGKAVKPIPYPTAFRTKREWNNYLENLYKMWGGKWSAE